jgi:type I restriction enzyme M protein
VWFITKNKRANAVKGYRNREQETLFIDARNMGTMTSRVHKELTQDDIALIADSYHAWRSDEAELKARVERGECKVDKYQDVAGFCKQASIDDIKAHDFVLTPGRYVGAAEEVDDGVPFETKMRELSRALYSQMNQAEALDKVIRSNLEALGYGE